MAGGRSNQLADERERAPRARRGTAERREQRRVEILDVAARLFAENGYDATSIDDLVAATGLQRGGLYHYIDSKQDLLVQIHARFVEPQVEEVRAIVAAGGSPDETLRRITHALIHSVATYRDQGHVFMHERRPMLDHPEWPAIRKLRREFEALVGDVFEQGMQRGIFHHADVRLTVLAYLGMVNSSYEWFRPGGRLTPQTVADRFAEIFLAGILVER